MAILSPSPKFAATFVDTNGFTKPAVGYKLYSYTAGTSTPKDTYTDITLGSANTNPVVLDARGEASVWLNGAHKLVLKTDVDVTVWTVDEIRDLTSDGIFTNASFSGTLTISSTAVTWSGNPIHSGNHTFTNNVTVKGNTQLGDQSTDTLRVDPNTVTWTNNPTHSGNHTWSGTQTLSSTLSVAGAATLSSALTLGFSLATGITGTTGQSIKATTYSQNSSAQVNITAFTDGFVVPYIQVGAFVVAGIYIDLSLTAGTTATSFELSLPVASNIAQAYDLMGVMTAGGVSARVSGQVANNTASISFTSNAAGTAGVCTGFFIYRVI